MTIFWKFAVFASVVLSLFAVGLCGAIWIRLEPEIVQGETDEINIDLTRVILRYHDQLQGIGPETITVRKVIQDALWYQVNNPQVSEQTRMECFAMIGLFHEGRATEVTPSEYETLVEAMRIVWGPGVLNQFENMVGGDQ